MNTKVIEQQKFFSQTQMIEEKFTEEQINALVVRPASYRELIELREVMMRKHSTSYISPKKQRKAA